MGRLIARLSALALLVGTAALVHGQCFPATASAHAGHPAGSRLIVIQDLGPYSVTVTLEPPSATSGPLFVDVAAGGAAADGTLFLSAVPFGTETGAGWQASVPLGAGGSPPRTVRLAVDGAGDWELLLHTQGTAGGGDARVPFTVAAPAGSLAATLFRGGLAALGLFLVAAVAVVGLGPRARTPGWVPWLLGPGAALSLALVAVTGVMRVALPPPDRSPPPMTAGVMAETRAELRTEPAAPRAGEPMTLTFDLSDDASGRPADDLVSHHEALVHGVLIADDGGSFVHVHPARIAPGRFAVSLTPERAGPLTFYAEIARRGGGTQTLDLPLVVAGPPPTPTPPAPAPTGLHKVGGYEIEGSTSPGTPRAGEPVSLAFRVLEDGRPVPALEPWLGMAGHLMVRSADGALFAHLHAAGARNDSGPGQGRSGIAAAGEALGVRAEAPSAQPEFGPEVDFGYLFPTAGDYRLWLQVKVDGRVLTLPLEITVQPAGEERGG